MLFYGPSGAGKKTRIMCTLRELFGPGVEKVSCSVLHALSLTRTACCRIHATLIAPQAEDRPEGVSHTNETETGCERGPEQLSHRAHSKVSRYRHDAVWILSHPTLHSASDVGHHDRSVVQDILKEIAQTQQVDMNAKKRFKGDHYNAKWR